MAEAPFSILNQQILPSNIWYETDINNINLKFEVEHDNNLQIQYKLEVNEKQVYPDDGYTSLEDTPTSINLDISVDDFDESNNSLVLYVKDENEEEETWNYEVKKEDIDTLTATRKLDFEEEWHIDDLESAKIKLDEGFKIEEGSYGENYVRTTDYTQVETEGRKTIQDVQVEGSEDAVEELDIKKTMEFDRTEDDGSVHRVTISMDGLSRIKDIRVEPVEEE